MSFDRDVLDHMVREGWLRCQKHPRADLWIYNYTERTQYENHWTPETLACRGLILDRDGSIVARPFPKFFNYGTKQAVVDAADEVLSVAEKIDGSLGILYLLPEDDEGPGPWTQLATRGSFTSDQARIGTGLLHKQAITWPKGTTPLFEIVYPENRIVVDYAGRRELVLLACLDYETGADRVDEVDWSGPRADRITDRDLADLAAHERPNAEGYVVTFASGARVKIKHDEYVRLHKIVTGINARSVWESLRAGDDLDALLAGVPDEIHYWVAGTKSALIDAYTEIEMAASEVYDRRPGSADRKALASYFTRSGANAAVLFRMLDERPYEDLIWKAVRPEAVTPEQPVLATATGTGTEDAPR